MVTRLPSQRRVSLPHRSYITTPSVSSTRIPTPTSTIAVFLSPRVLMATAAKTNDPWKFPAVKTVVGPNKGTPGTTYYGAYFYPFTPPHVDPVFAVVGGRETIIAHPHPTRGIEIIQYFHDDLFFPTEALCSACWTRCTVTGDPLLAVGGAAGIIKILNVKTGKVVQTLTGHGDEIMEILLSPVDQTLIASASADSTVRVWSIHPNHERQPCALVCAGEGHKETILSIAFHSSGRYLLSGGMDHIVNLWVLPNLPDGSTGTDKPIILHYPHFSTSMVHSNYIDCLVFHGDYILSKAAKESRIVLWAIQNFTSKAPPPKPEEAPTTHEWRETRSAFGGSFDRLLQFEIKDTEPFFMRFGFFARPGSHPLLVMGSTLGRVNMWDLMRTEKLCKHSGTPDRSTEREESVSSMNAVIGGPPKIKSVDDCSDPFGVVKPHHCLDIPKVKTPIRHIAFSLGGDYMVMVGEQSMICVCKRW